MWRENRLYVFLTCISGFILFYFPFCIDCIFYTILPLSIRINLRV